MAATSNHHGDVAIWIEKVINSCETYQQTFGARQLILNFEKQLQRKHPEKYWREHFYNLISPLESLLSHKRDQLVKKEFKS